MSGPGDGGPRSVALDHPKSDGDGHRGAHRGALGHEVTGAADADGFPSCGSALAVADALLYEGYLLYPYRRSSGKNRVRWQFGVLAPREWVQARPTVRESVAGSADTWRQRTECLVEARSGARLRLRVRFLQVQQRSVQQRSVQQRSEHHRPEQHRPEQHRPEQHRPEQHRSEQHQPEQHRSEDPTSGRPSAGDDLFVAVDALNVDGNQHLSFEEAVPRELDVTVSLDALTQRAHVELITIPSSEDIERLGEQARVVRTRWPVSARVRLSLSRAPAPFPLWRLRVDVENAVTAVAPGTPRAEVLRRSLVSTHSLLSLRDGIFVSLLEPPAWAWAAAKACTNLHTFPVLAGENDGRAVVLSSPVIMYDHPGIAPESPVDLFDACEIDEILTLRTLTLTDEEKAEARATDPRAATIVDRAEVIPDEMFARLHGAVRSLRPVSNDVPVQPEPAVPWWDPGAEAMVAPETDAVVVDGVPIARGSRVRLHPPPSGADAHDMFLEGRVARVEAVLLDVDGSRHIAVVLDDDPGADLHRWYGRYHYFGPDEVSPVADLHVIDGPDSPDGDAE